MSQRPCDYEGCGRPATGGNAREGLYCQGHLRLVADQNHPVGRLVLEALPKVNALENARSVDAIGPALDALRTAIGAPVPSRDDARKEAALKALARRVGEGAMAAVHAEVARMTSEAAVADESPAG